MVSAGLTLIFGMMGRAQLRPTPGSTCWGAYVGFTPLPPRTVGFLGRADLRAADHRLGAGGALVERYMAAPGCTSTGHAHEACCWTFGLAFIIEEVIKLLYYGGLSR